MRHGMDVVQSRVAVQNLQLLADAHADDVRYVSAVFLINDCGQRLWVDVIAETVLYIDIHILHFAFFDDVAFTVILGSEATAGILRHINGLSSGRITAEGDRASNGSSCREIYLCCWT